MLNRRTVLATGAIAAVPLSTSLGAMAQSRKDAVTLAMTLEPPGLDPTAGAASAIAEIVQYNIFYLELAIDRTEFIKLYDFEAQEAPDPDALMAQSQAAPRVPAPPPAGQDDTDALLKSLGM